jgi:hypothetical protein
VSGPATDIARDADKVASTWFSGHVRERALDIASASPAGRILPSLVESVPRGLSATESKPPKRPSRQGSLGDKTTKAKGSNAQSASGRRRRMSLDDEDLRASSQGSLKAAPDDPVQAHLGDERVLTAPEQVETPVRTGQTAATSTAAEKPQRRGRRSRSQTDSENILAPIGAALSSASNGQPANSSILYDDDVSRKRHQSILARYVFGTEPKLGERWKRKLRRP